MLIMPPFCYRAGWAGSVERACLSGKRAGWSAAVGCAYHAPPTPTPQNHVILYSGKRAGWSAAAERMCLSCPPPPQTPPQTPPPRTRAGVLTMPPPHPLPRAMLLCNPVTEQAGLQQLTGCAYHAAPPPRAMLLCNPATEQAGQLSGCAYHPPPNSPPPEPCYFVIR